MKKYFSVLASVCLLSCVFNLFSQQQRITLNPSLRPFYHGVASGDPTDSKVIIWTRVTPDTGTTGDIDVYWQIATDTNFNNIVNYGKLTATEENHYCVKADVCGLNPSTFYYYMFNALGRNSIMARTKTAPASATDNDSVRFAVVSCASWEHGYFNAYEKVSQRNDIDAVVHLGDYIYEYESGGFSANISGRTYEPTTEAVTELGYELRHSQYKLDDQLRRIHQLYPFITVWDDHETCNDAWKSGGQNHTPGTEGNFSDRKRNSTSTYFKWMPIRKPDPADTIRIFRKLRYGKLLDLIMLDTRLYDRDEQDLGATNDSSHHLMGPYELSWFINQLDDTATRWKIIGNQVMFAPLEVFGQPVNADQWDGYNYERTQIENHILNHPVNDVVILTGDIHTSWCNDVPGPNYNNNTGAGSVCVEFVGSSVTSANSPLPVGSGIIQTLNQHVKYVNTSDKGYYTLDVKKGKTQADYNYMSTVTSLGATENAGPSFYVNHNERFLRSSNNAISAPKISAPLPPLLPKQNIGIYKITDHAVVIPENTQTTVNIIPSLQVCPALSVSIVDYPNIGSVVSLDGMNETYTPFTDMNGNDTIAFAFCTNDSTPVCDTVYLFVTILSVQDIDSTFVDIEDGKTYTDCFSFNDLAARSNGVNYSAPQHGAISLNDTCFTYHSDSLFCGSEIILFTTCDSLHNCDTVVFIFKVNHPVFASVIEINLNKNSNITNCNLFDDLLCAPVSISVLKNPANATFQIIGDSCIKFSPYFNYFGNDTMKFAGCDTCAPDHCDTTTVIFHTLNPTTVEENMNLVVFGMFPNPVGDKLVVQYYLYEAAETEFNVYDATGRKVSSDKIFAASGLQHVQLNMTGLPAGNYIAELKAGENTYRKKVLKE